MKYNRFDPARRPEEYQGQAGPYYGLALNPQALESIAEGKMRREPASMIVRGEWIRDDGARFLEFAISRAWIEGHTDYRADESGTLNWTCPVCDRLHGSHSKSCNFE